MQYQDSDQRLSSAQDRLHANKARAVTIGASTMINFILRYTGRILCYNDIRM